MCSYYIYIKEVEITDETFHARLSAKKKEYRYIVSLNEYDPLKANYQYFYEDRNALIDRRAKMQEAFSMMNAAANNPVLFERIDWVEVLKTGLESNGFDNVDKFFKDPSPIDEIAEQIKKMPEQVQQSIGQRVIPIIQEEIFINQQLQSQQQGVLNANTKI